jgi:phage tail-like protein
MRDDYFLARFVSVFEVIAASQLEHIDQLEHVFDRTVAPPAMARALGRCVGIDVLDPALPETFQREVLLELQALARWQGTRRRLTRVLEVVTMAPVDISDSGGVYASGDAPSAAPHVRIAVESTGWMDEDNLLGLVRRELPASVTFELRLGDRCLWPQPEHTTVDASTTSCPVCGSSTGQTVPLMDADGFCRTCDFPLFWAPGARLRSAVGEEVMADVAEDTVGRPAVVDCPVCDRVTEIPANELRTAAGFCPGCDFPLWWATP